MINQLSLFLEEHFEGLTLKPALFYSYKYGIRFEISMPGVEHGEKKNLLQMQERMNEIFHRVFTDEDEMLLVTDIHCDKNDTFLQKRPTKVYQKYIKNKELRKKLQHKMNPSVFLEEDMVTHRYVLACKKNDIRYQPLLTAISYEDFPHPSQILRGNFRASIDIYFVNVSKKMIYHLYDDRGCDVIASNKNELLLLYKDLNNWILDYDRGKIDTLFNK